MEIPKGCKTPGQLLLKLIEQREWTQRIVAIILGVGETIINKIASGQRSVDAEMAVMFEGLFGVDANIFLELQQSYDLAKARLTAMPDANRTNRATLFGDLPISEMIKRRWLDAEDVKNVSQVESALTKFFGVESLDQIEVLPHAAQKTQVATPATPTQLVWIYKVREIANEMMVATYSPKKVREALQKLEVLMMTPDDVRKVPRILAECGIRFVIVETIGSAKIDGVCFWLDDESPVIGMTLRFDRIDNFWFVLRHEMEHILRLHGRTSIMMDAELEGEKAGTSLSVLEEERQANEAAAEFGVSSKMIQKFIDLKSPIFREIDLLGFAKTMQVHPGIVVGRLQRQTGRYDLFRQHLVKIRTKITPSAMVDGWGDIASTGH
jgi:HTH-type transcriptional regulator / antitoxin HigA